MTYDEAMKILRKVPSAMDKKHGLIIYGARVRRPGMGRGWSIFYIGAGAVKGYYCLNPHTGSDYQFYAQAADIGATTWEIVK